MNKFKLVSKFKPAGDQPKAIKQLSGGLRKGYNFQTLLGVTGSGKTFTMANVIAAVNRPTLVIAHNKTLAAQLTQEYRTFFPENAVEYFVSYYDYYQPESYLPNTDTYIEKESSINEEIDRLRHAATQAILTRRDVVIVASVSAIYGIGSPESYKNASLFLSVGQKISREDIISKLVQLQFERNEAELCRGTFRTKGTTIEVFPVHEEKVFRVELSDNEQVEKIIELHHVSRKRIGARREISIYPARHYVSVLEDVDDALGAIRKEANERTQWFRAHDKLVEAQRLERRIKYDVEMIRAVGYVNGIENYSRYFDSRRPGEPPYTLLDYFSASGRSPVERHKDFLLIIDESHVTIPQIRGMYEGDRSRKQTLIDFGFRLPSALDNRPLKFQEFEQKIGNTIFTSATPGSYESQKAKQVVEQIIRPTGLVDPEIIIRPASAKASVDTKVLADKSAGKLAQNQVEDLIARIKDVAKKGDRVLVTTLTKRMAEDLAEFLREQKIKVHYLHSEVHTLERIETLTNLRTGKYDVIVGVNLLREGLDLPEVSLVAILDADKEGFLRSTTSLIQTMGRAARNAAGHVILYADEITGSIKKAIDEANRRRVLQLAYNRKHGITPQTIKKDIKDILEGLSLVKKSKKIRSIIELETLDEKVNIDELIGRKRKEMKEAAKSLEFELAALLRDEIVELKKLRSRKRKPA